MEDIKLDDSYILWYHSITDDDWSKESYIEVTKELGEIKTIVELWRVYKSLENNFNAGIFFLMRKGIFPSWEDKRNGGDWSFKASKKEANVMWMRLSAAFVGNSISDKPLEVNGLSISPKISNSVIKIWTTGKSTKIKNLDNTNLRYNIHK